MTKRNGVSLNVNKNTKTPRIYLQSQNHKHFIYMSLEWNKNRHCKDTARRETKYKAHSSHHAKSYAPMCKVITHVKAKNTSSITLEICWTMHSLWFRETMFNPTANDSTTRKCFQKHRVWFNTEAFLGTCQLFKTPSISREQPQALVLFANVVHTWFKMRWKQQHTLLASCKILRAYVQSHYTCQGQQRKQHHVGHFLNNAQPLVPENHFRSRPQMTVERGNIFKNIVSESTPHPC